MQVMTRLINYKIKIDEIKLKKIINLTNKLFLNKFKYGCIYIS